MKIVNIDAEIRQLTEFWRPAVVGDFNQQEIKIARLCGEFVWHQHADSDEVFIVRSGRLRMEFRDGCVELGPGDLLKVPKGVEHRPVAKDEVEVLLLEAAGTLNTGDVTDSRLTAPADDRRSV